ncbi:DMT family transporter [Pseudalkalibacillus caeni]|uniref:DMT family transporter n=1 Tax=Exobacillus caeni TaxID=2574798 RepID=UPI00269FC3F5
MLKSKSFIYISLLVIMIIWGFNVVAIKLLVEYFKPLTIQSIRIFTASLVVFSVLGMNKPFRRLTAREWLLLGMGALTGVVAHHSLLAIGLTQTTASNTGLILGLVPLMTAIFAVIFLRDRLTPLKIVGIILAFAGVTFVVLSGNSRIGEVSSGDLFVFYRW